MALKPFEWKDKPSLIEYIFPVQKISAESFKEQMARQGKSLTALGSYWKGRKPLILNKSCILGSLLPVTENRLKDLEIFELLMGMDAQTMRKRLKAKFPASKHNNIDDYLTLSYNEQVKLGKRPEEMKDVLSDHIWTEVNAHLGTAVQSFPELIEQMGIARFGRRPKVADVFSGSGQIPFEAARLGCDVYASDLNPIACMLTWGTFNIVGASKDQRSQIDKGRQQCATQVQKEIDTLGVETDGTEWRTKVYLYCVEVICPESGWKVPLLTTRIISKGYQVIAELVPIPEEKRYHIAIRYVDSRSEVETAEIGTIQRGDIVHSPDGVHTYRVSIKTIRGDYREGKKNKTRLRLWEKSDFVPRADDILQERLYCIQWMKPKTNSLQYESEFRSVTDADLLREQKVIDYVAEHLEEWQQKGYIPDMVIEDGAKTNEPIRTRGWTHWHHLFNPRQLLRHSFANRFSTGSQKLTFLQVLNGNSRLCMWAIPDNSRAGCVAQTFSNQALNTMYNYGCRASDSYNKLLVQKYASYPFTNGTVHTVHSHPAQDIEIENDIYITDPPYGDAVNYEEITEFFIAWIYKNPPQEFAHWTWDSRRSLAIKGEGEEFRQGMIAAYRKMTQKMPNNGIQVMMFTHQSGAIWADMANIVWASGLQVTAAWYVVTETDTALRKGAHVKGTVILILRKRKAKRETFRDDLGWEIESAVKDQVESLIGLDKQVKSQGSEGLYSDADLQMAGYAAALKVLTSYSRIDGKDMIIEAEAPRQKDKKTFVDALIDFAVQTAVQFLVPLGFEKDEWQKLEPTEKFYLKMVEMEHKGVKTLDNYQNFAKAFKVRHFDQLMSDTSKANASRIKLSTEFKNSLMSGDVEIAGTPLRALLYALFELSKDMEINDVLLHLMENCPNYLQNKGLLSMMSDYLAEKRESLKSSNTSKFDTESSCARVLAEAIRNQRL